MLPSDASWGEGGVVAAPLPVPPAKHADEAALANAVRVLRSGEPTLILLGGHALRQKPLADAAAIAAATGCQLVSESFNTRMERGRGRHPVDRVPFAVEAALTALAPYRHLILVNAADPVAFFAYPGRPGRLFPAAGTVHTLAARDEDGPAALAALAAALGAPPVNAPSSTTPGRATGPRDAGGSCRHALRHAPGRRHRGR